MPSFQKGWWARKEREQCHATVRGESPKTLGAWRRPLTDPSGLEQLLGGVLQDSSSTEELEESELVKCS